MPVKKKTPRYFSHKSAVIDRGAKIGSKTKIWHFSHVMGGAVIGEECNLGQNVYVAATAVLGDGVKIQNNVSIYDGVLLEDRVFCGPSMVFTNVSNPRSGIERKAEYQKTIVRKGATIGANATVVCGVEIGEYVVTTSIPAHALFYGVPAKQKGWVCECGVKLETSRQTLECSACGRSYDIHPNGLVLR